MRTIIFFKGIYDTLDMFTEDLQRAFADMGYGVFVYDAARETESKEALLALLAQRGNADTSGTQRNNDGNTGEAVRPGSRFACVTFNNMGYNLDIPSENGASKDAAGEAQNSIFSRESYGERHNVWEYYGIPYINILMDHPFHYDRPLKMAPSTAVVLCTDRYHVRYIRRFYKNIRQADFLPHAGVELGRRHKPLAERGIDVLYAGALPIYTVSDMIPDLKSIEGIDAEKMAGEVLEELVIHPDKTTEQAIEEYVRAVCSADGMPTDKELGNLIVKMRFLDSYATSFFREQAVRILVESGIRVTAFGTGWDRCEWSGHPNLDYRGKVPAPEILPLMNDSKIVLNTMTWFKAGAHDRVFNGMLAKAAVVTDDSVYMRQEFTDGKELVMFSRAELPALPERVSALFGHMGQAQELAERGYRAAAERHTWRKRAEYIAECFFD